MVGLLIPLAKVRTNFHSAKYFGLKVHFCAFNLKYAIHIGLYFDRLVFHKKAIVKIQGSLQTALQTL